MCLSESGCVRGFVCLSEWVCEWLCVYVYNYVGESSGLPRFNPVQRRLSAASSQLEEGQTVKPTLDPTCSSQIMHTLSVCLPVSDTHTLIINTYLNST